MMNRIGRHLFKVLVLIVLLKSAALTQAKEWKGIVPLESTRADVIRLLNQCHETREGCLFDTKDENVFILFSGGVVESRFQECILSIKPETVMYIEVVPKQLKVRDLKLPEKALSGENSIDLKQEGLKGYEMADGLLLTVNKEDVVRQTFIGVQRCGEFYDDNEMFLQEIQLHPPPPLKCPAETNGPLVKVMGHSPLQRGPVWNTNSGRIVSGQYTNTVVVNVEGLAGQSVSVEAEYRDWRSSHTAKIVCTIKVLPN
jgi:hypothetical protein